MRMWNVFLGKIRVSRVMAENKASAQKRAEQEMAKSNRNPQNRVVSVEERKNE